MKRPYKLSPVRSSPPWDDSFAGKPVRLHTAYKAPAVTEKSTVTEVTEPRLRLGNRIVLNDGKSGIVKWVGRLQSRYVLKGLWVGVCLNGPQTDSDLPDDTYNLDSCDGMFGQTRYFKCTPRHGRFVKISKVRKVLVKYESGYSEYKPVFHRNPRQSGSMVTKSSRATSSGMGSSTPIEFVTPSTNKTDLDKLIMEGNVQGGSVSSGVGKTNLNKYSTVSQGVDKYSTGSHGGTELPSLKRWSKPVQLFKTTTANTNNTNNTNNNTTKTINNNNTFATTNMFANINTYTNKTNTKTNTYTTNSTTNTNTNTHTTPGRRLSRYLAEYPQS